MSDNMKTQSSQSPRILQKNNMPSTNSVARRQDGIEVPQDLIEAFKLYKKSAAQGNAEAQNNLGSCYENAAGVKQDLTKAIKFYDKAASQVRPTFFERK